MSKTVPVYGGSSRPCSPACALLYAPRCLAVSRISPPVHGVSTTSVTTPGSGDQRQPADQDADPASQNMSLRYLECEMSAYGCEPSVVGPIANVHALSGPADYALDLRAKVMTRAQFGAFTMAVPVSRKRLASSRQDAACREGRVKADPG
jgi:hypothetical protein